MILALNENENKTFIISHNFLVKMQEIYNIKYFHPDQDLHCLLFNV